MEPTNEPLILRSPMSPDEWDAYFDLRWRILCQPWGQPRGSERDALDDSAVHLLLLARARKPLACGGLQFHALDEVRLGFLAVDDDSRGGGCGRRIGEGVRAEAARRDGPTVGESE